MFDMPVQAEDNPFAARSVENLEQAHEREVKVFRIVDLVKGTNAERANLQLNDVIIELDGAPVTTFVEMLQHVVSKNGSPLSLKIVRNNRILEVEVPLTYSEERKRYLMGIMLEERLCVAKQEKDSERWHERRKGVYENGQGEPLCGYEVDLDMRESALRLGVTTGKPQETGRLIHAISLTYERNGEKQAYDILSRFNTVDEPVYLSTGLLDSSIAGYHDPREDRIVVRDIETPAYIGTLLHEFTHAEQNRDPQWREFFRYYPCYKLYVEFGTWDAERLQTIPIHVGLIARHVLKRFERGVSPAHAREVMADKEGPILKSIDNNAEALRDADDLLLTKVHAAIEDKTRAMLHEWTRREHWPKDHPDNETVYKDMKYIGFIKNNELPIDCLGRIYEPLPIEEGNLQRCASMLHAILVGKVRAFGMMFDKDKGLLSITLGQDLTRAYGQSVQIDIPMSDSEYQILNKADEEKIEALAKVIENQVSAQETLLNSALSGDITIRDILSYPRWIVERDAERGKLMGLRAIRTETGLDLLGSLGAVPPGVKKFQAQHADRVFRRSMSQSELEEMERRTEAIEEDFKDGRYAPQREVENVRDYMGHIGATPRNIRKFRKRNVGKQEEESKKSDDMPEAA